MFCVLRSSRPSAFWHLTNGSNRHGAAISSGVLLVFFWCSERSSGVEPRRTQKRRRPEGEGDMGGRWKKLMANGRRRRRSEKNTSPPVDLSMVDGFIDE